MKKEIRKENCPSIPSVFTTRRFLLWNQSQFSQYSLAVIYQNIMNKNYNYPMKMKGPQRLFSPLFTYIFVVTRRPRHPKKLITTYTWKPRREISLNEASWAFIPNIYLIPSIDFMFVSPPKRLCPSESYSQVRRTYGLVFIVKIRGENIDLSSTRK